MTNIIAQEIIENKILLIRGHKVILDRDLAALYGVETKHLTRQVRRNVTAVRVLEYEFDNLVDIFYFFCVVARCANR